MQGSLDQPPIVVRGSRAYGVWLLIGSVLLVGLGAALLAGGQTPIIGVLTIGFFSLCGAVGLAVTISPPRLEIGPSGAVQTALWRTTTFAWTDVHNFRPTLVGLSTRLVGFDYLNAPPNRAGLRSLNMVLSSAQGALRPGWEIAPDKLANLLNQARERWVAGAAARG